MFWLKQWLGSLLMPLPLGLMLLLAGLLLRRRRGGRLLVGAGLLVLLLFCGGPLPERLLAGLEWQQTPLTTPVPGVRYVEVLGDWNLYEPALSPLQQLRPSALARLVEGVRQLRANPGSRLIVSGYGSAGRRSHALVMRDAAVALGVAPADIQVVDGPRDTAEEALLVGRLVGNEPFILVTNAAHMRRALALFRHQGCRPVPAPTDYLTPRPGTPVETSLRELLPSSLAVEQSEQLFHETLGLWWARLRGQV